MSSNAQSLYTPQQHTYSNTLDAAAAPPAFFQATPQGSQPPASAEVPSNAGSGSVPGALQPAGGRPVPSSAFTAPTIVPTMQQAPPIQTNAQQYTQLPSRSNTLHSHSRSSPAGMEGPSKYIPFTQTPTGTPTAASNPKAYNISHTQTPLGAGPSHSPLNLTDIRSRAISDANEGGAGTNVLFSYSETATNSNYLAPFATYAYDWCKWPVVNGGASAGKMAVGSYLEDPHNFIQILDTQITPQEVSASGQAPYGLEYTKVAEATCAYPVTRILWEPPSSQKQSTDLLATSGDHLRLWSLPQSTAAQLPSNSINRSASGNTREQPPQKLQPLALLSNSKTPEHTAPLTSLDWNTLSPKLIITSSIDTTCTIWDIPTLTAKTQLIAHDKEVYDVRFCAGSVDVFVSCGADGSVRMFDLRSLEHSTIIYEPAEKTEKSSSPTSSSPTKTQQHTLNPAPPLLRLAASPHDAHLLATFAQDSNIIRILDVRQPGTALLELRGHGGNVNTIEWNPSRRGMLASGGDDSLVLTWDLLNASNQASLTSINGNGVALQAGEVQVKGPSSSWRCEYEVANVSWAPQSPLTSQGGDWLGICGGRGVWGVKL
ncbi:WD40 repeat-like protein [Teratosphaeria nubilosa]|uniref:WD40 repeat-like protein n=1 Tax=Teratosphaeria nubilosa TaxID=161662 RepID=A0A6G1KTT2_9PEZI|nr:WD40 repeat-like protein [Teratosphaeria nubilosa]